MSCSNCKNCNNHNDHRKHDDCGCDCGCHHGHDHCDGPRPFPLGQNAFPQGITVSEDTKIPNENIELVVVDEEDVTVTLPSRPRDGQAVTVISRAEGTKVCGGCFELCLTEEKEGDEDEDDEDDEDETPSCVDVPECFSVTFRFVRSSCGCDGVWIVSFGSPNAVGDGTGSVANIAELAALDTSALACLSRVLVRTLDQYWELLCDSTAAPDGITIVKASNGPGNWGRIETFSKKWSLAYLGGVRVVSNVAPFETVVGGAFVDAANGNDENDGLTPATAVKTNAEIFRRLHESPAGKNIQVTNLSDVPYQESTPRPFGTVLIKDRARPSFVSEQNPEDFNVNAFNQVLDGSTPALAPTGIEQIFNYSLNGSTFSVAGTTTTLSAFSATSAAAQATATFANAALAAAGGELFRITASSDAGNIGATAAIGANLGGGVARISDFSASPGKTLNLAAIPGSTVELVKKTQWNTSLIQLMQSQGRMEINDWDYTAAPAIPNDQVNLTQRNVSHTFFRCVFRRPEQISFGCASTLSGCSVTFDSLTIWTTIGGVTTYLASLFRNADVRVINGVPLLQINGMYIEGGRFQTYTTSNVPDYGGALAATATKGDQGVVIAGAGLSIYNWPAAPLNAGLILSDGAHARAGAQIRGGIDGGRAGAVAVYVRSNSQLLIAQGIVPTIAGDNGGTGADLRINNPYGSAVDSPAGAGLSDLAVRATQAGGGNIMGIEAAGAVTLDAELLKTWANWNTNPGAGGTTFGRFAFNPHDGSRVCDAPTA